MNAEWNGMADLKGAHITWLGHAAVLITTAKGTQILIDPFLEQNPKYPKDYKLPEKIDLLLLSHGHGDHIADAVSVAKKHHAQAVGIFELTAWIHSKGVEDTVGMNLGGTYKFRDVAISLVEAQHSSSIQDGNDIIYAGVAAGFVVTVDGGPILYHAGDTSLFSDMQIIKDLYAPEIGFIPIGDHYTMGPKAAALAANYLGLKTVIPIHYGTFPQLTGTPEELEKHLQKYGIETLELTPGIAAK
jgi:L-ascorbate metabolism protein UlaG (beta-lactamase superfamily)